MGCGATPHKAFKRSAKGEFQNSSSDCFERGNALQERAFPTKVINFLKVRLLKQTNNVIPKAAQGRLPIEIDCNFHKKSNSFYMIFI